MNKFLYLIALFGVTLGLAQPATAQADKDSQAEPSSVLKSRLDAVVAMINGDQNPEDHFSQAFLAAISPAQFKTMSDGLTAQFGSALGVEAVDPAGEYSGEFAIRFEKAIGRGQISVESAPPHLINGLRLTGFEPIDDSPDKIAADLAALPGSTAAWFGPLDAEPVFTHGDGQAQFAIGSTFKLYILAALSRGVDEGRLSWDQVVPLSSRSLPSGIAQDWPAGSPITLHTLATLMISISDNTATDTLIDVVGREAIEAELRASGHGMPEKTTPFLKTLEMFVLKAIGGGEEYATADTQRRRAMLGDLDLTNLDDERFMQVFTGKTPVLIDTVEWFASMEDQRALMRVIAALPDDTVRDIMAVNDALTDAEAARWDYVGFKGGSEPGVMNLAWLLRDKAGGWHMLALSWNDTQAEVNQSALSLLAQRILALAN